VCLYLFYFCFSFECGVKKVIRASVGHTFMECVSVRHLGIDVDSSQSFLGHYIADDSATHYCNTDHSFV